jgi:hypothetical protein
MFKKIKNLPFEKILAIISVFVLFFITGLALYDRNQQDVIVHVKLEKNQDPFVALPQIVPENSFIQSVRQTDKIEDEYMVTIKTRRKKKDLLEWIKNAGGVRDAR